MRPSLCRVIWSAAVLVALGCSSPPPDPRPTVRLVPTVAGGSAQAMAALFDRDTTTQVTLSGPVELALVFDAEVELRAVKAFGAVDVSLVADPVPAQSFGSERSDRWDRRELDEPVASRGFSLRLTPTAPGASLAELEVWGAGRAQAPRDPRLLALATRTGGASLSFENVRTYEVTPASATLNPAGSAQGNRCASFQVSLSEALLPSARRVFLAYEAEGAIRAFELERSVDGQPPVGGLWLGNGRSDQQTLVDELNPDELAGAHGLSLCLPPEATTPVKLSRPRLVLELDDGHNLLDRTAQTQLASAFDGDDESVASFPATTLALGLTQRYELEALTVKSAGRTQVRLGAKSSPGAEWVDFGALELTNGWNELPATGAGISGLRIGLQAPRPDVPAAAFGELRLRGSPIGARRGEPRLVITYPAPRLTARGEVGERFGDQAFISGWADGPQGPATVEIDGVRVSDLRGHFGEALRRPLDAQAEWKVRVVARFADGTELSREVTFEDDRSSELSPEAITDASGAVAERFGNENQTSWGKAEPGAGGKVRLGTSVELDVPPGAVGEATSLGITRKGEDATPPLDPGMVNVTAPTDGAYRFSPRGKKFLKPVRVKLPYDDRLLPEGISPDQIKTFFFDEVAEKWVPLKRVEVARINKQVVSETDHFTFMINAVLVMPEHPGPVAFDPTSIKSLESGSPDEGIELIAAPQPNGTGSARLSLPIQLPAARGAYQPPLAMSYDSSGANGYLGVGWDLASSSVAVDTRFGVPFYDGDERYTLDGDQLVPLALQDTCVDGTTGRRYATRVERDFRRILRCGADTRSYRFEVTDKGGTLYLYGPSTASRLASYYVGAEHIAQWFLERVIDANGNLTEYSYRLDKKGLSTTPLDAAQGEDFRELYLAGIRYTGRASREGSGALAGGTHGPYFVELLPQSSASGNLERFDVVTTARAGFKSLMRHRLGRVKVWAELPTGNTLVREYRLHYTQGDFSKSLLQKVELFGLGGVDAGRLFHAHELDYSRSESTAPFGAQTESWRFVTGAGLDALDERAMTATEDFSVGAHVYVGIGPGPMKESGSAGLRLGYNHREGSTHALLVDLNGDNLPDRVTRTGLRLNQGAQKLMSPLAPAGDPHVGTPVFSVGGSSGLDSLGSDSGDSFNIAAQAQYGSFSANLGYTYTTSTSREFLMDADGDGLTDYVGPGEVLFNQTRSPSCTTPASCCPAGQFCFRPDKTITTAPALGGTGGLLAGDPQLEDMREEVNENFHPTDALIEWTAPYDGTVDVSGVLAWATPHPTAAPKRDGVRLRIYLEGAQQLEVLKAYSDNSATPVAVSGVPVSARQRLYFLLSTRSDFPVDTPENAPPVPIEEASFSPRISYTSCSGACGALGDGDASLASATGAPLFTFDAKEDFRLAGDPMSGVLVPRDGMLRLSWSLTKTANTSDDVRVCVQRYAIGAEVANRPCAAGDLMRRGVAWNETLNGHVDVHELRASAGDQLIFRVESDVSFDPGAISSSITGEMYEVCTASGCAPPTDDFPAPSFTADPFVALHDRVDPVPLRPFVVPRSGTLVISSSSGGTFGSQVFFTARAPGRVLLKATGAHDVDVRRQVTAGEQILFEAHGENFWLGGWDLDVGMEQTAPDGTVVIEWLSVPSHRTSDRTGNLLSPVMAGTSPFGGGYHGWRYGLWGGRDDETFDPAIFSADYEAPEGSDEDKMDESLDRLDDPNSQERRRARLFATLLPRRLGTHIGQSHGLKPGLPAYVSQDGNTFITATTMHGGRKGGFVKTADGSASVAAAFDVPDMMRSSIGHTVSGGLGVSVLSVSVSGGVSNQKIDVLDLNGDRIIDVATGASGRLTHLRKLNVRQSVPLVRGLRTNYDLSANAGLGISDAIRMMSPSATVKAVSGMFPTGAGIGVNLSATGNDLVDVNGDGLPDEVRRDGTKFKVRLNLGTRFAASEDDLPVGLWPESGVFDAFVQDVAGSGILGGTGGRSKEQESRGKIAEAVQLLGTADVLRRNTSVTLQANAGVRLNESYGVNANWETSLGTTSVALVDVTGDGLPDYVRKSSHDTELRVKVNRGYDFDPQEKRWTLPDWPENTDPAFVLGLFSLLDRADTVKKVLPKVLGPEKADGVEANGTHSALPSVGFVVTVPIPLSPFMTPWLHLSGGADVAPKRVSGFELGFSDLNGDGLVDHVLKTERGGSVGTERAEAIHARINQLGGGNLLKTVRRPMGGKIALEYARTQNSVDLPESRYVLSKVTVDDGLGAGTGHALTTTYQYEGGRYDRAERELLGFRSVRERRPDGSKRILTFHVDRFERRGLLEREELRDAFDRLYTATVNEYGTARAVTGTIEPGCAANTPFFLDPAAYCGSTFVPLLRTERRFYEGETVNVDEWRLRSAQTFDYDAAGNVSVFEDLGDPEDSSDDVHARMTYASDPTAQRLYLLDRVTRLAVHAGRATSPGALLRERVGHYADGRGNLTRLESAIGGGAWAVSDLLWTANGTIEKVTGPANETGDRYEISYKYDGTTGTYLIETTDSFGYTSSGKPDLRFGGYLETHDLNGNTIVREVDEFGRLISVRAPTDLAAPEPTTKIVYHHDALPFRAETLNRLPAAAGDVDVVTTVIAQDGFGRTIQTKRTVDVHQLGVGMSVSGKPVFDAMGRVVREGQATFSATIDASFVDNLLVRPTAYSYDVLGRIVREEEPDGSVTTNEHGFGSPAGSTRPKFRTRTTDAANNVQVSYEDVLAREVAMEEHLDAKVLTTRYEYDPSGNLSAIVDAAGNRSTFGYDLLGRRLTQQLPDTGLTEFGYDPAGNLVRKVTPNLRAVGAEIRYHHQYTRLVRVDHPFSADIVYEFGGPDAQDNGRNRPIRIHDEAGTEELTYGKLGEVVRTVRTLNPLKPGDRPRRFETQFRFDPFGRMLELVYPDGERLTYHYDAGGSLRRAVGHREATHNDPAQDEVYLAEARYNLFGQKAHLRYGNGVQSDFTYDPLNLKLKTVTTVTPFSRHGAGGRTLQAITYDYDEVGNVTSMVNALGRPHHGQSGEVRYGFKYDDLYRLVEARGSAEAGSHKVDRFIESWEYSDIHNMTRSARKRELVRSLSIEPEFDHPLRDNRDELYTYAGWGPHQPTRIGDTTLTYDANGNTLSECRAVEGRTCDETLPPNGSDGSVTRQKLKRFQWNEENWLTAVVENGQNATRFVYDAGGNRIAKLGRGGPSVTIGQFFAVKGRNHATKHVFAGTERIATKLIAMPEGDIGIAGQTLTASLPPDNQNGCIPSDDQPQKCDVPVVTPPIVIDGAQRLKPATFYYHPDHLGSTQWVTDAQGKVHEHVEHYAYGEVWRSPRADSDGGPTHHQSFLFTSKEFDEETGLTYFGARYYNARHARWISPDPVWGIQGPVGLNVYQYVGWNPTNKVDRDGRWLESAWDVASFAMGVHAISQWDKNTSTWTKVLDVGGLVVDGAAIVLPVVPGGVGAALKVARAGNRVDNVVDGARGVERGVETVTHAKQGEQAVEAATETAKAAENTASVAKAADDAPAVSPGPSNAAKGVQANKAAGDAWSQAVGAELKATNEVAVPEITVRTQSGVRTRLDWVTKDAAGNFGCVECKASATAPLTPNQAAAFPEISTSGATVVGKGKPGVPGGTVIPPTTVEIKRP